MAANYTLIPVPLGADNPATEPLVFPIELIAQLTFDAGEVQPQAVRAVLEDHPLLGRSSDQPIACYAMEFAAWEAGGRQFDAAKAIRLSLRYGGGPTLASLAANLRKYLMPPNGVKAATAKHDATFDRLPSSRFVNVAQAHDALKEISETIHASALRFVPASSVGSDDARSSLSMDALKWVDSSSRAMLLEAVGKPVEGVLSALSQLRMTGSYSVLQDAVTKIARRLDVADSEGMLLSAKGALGSGGPAGDSIDPNDPNVAINTALKHPLLARSCGLVTSWRVSAERALRGDFVFILPETSLGQAKNGTPVLCKATAFRRGALTHPLAFADLRKSTTSNSAFAQLNDKNGRVRYRASSVQTEAEIVKEIILQANNSLATPSAMGSESFGDFTASLDERPPQLLRAQQYGSTEPETCGVTFSAPVEDLATPKELSADSPEEREKAYPCLFLEDLWVGFRVDLKFADDRKFSSIHRHSVKVTMSRSSSEISGRVEDYVEREQSDDDARGFSSTELTTYVGMTTHQLRDYLEFTGEQPTVLVPPTDAPFKSEVTDYEGSVPLIFGNIYSYRLRLVLSGCIGLSPEEADKVTLGQEYQQVFPFFRAHTLRPGEIIGLDDTQRESDVRKIFLSERRKRASVSVVPAPLNAEQARFHGLLLSDVDEPEKANGRKIVADLAKFLNAYGDDLNYYYDPDVSGIVVRVKLLNGPSDPSEGKYRTAGGAYCELKPHVSVPPTVLMFGTGSWESFRRIEIVVAVGEHGPLRVEVGKRRIEIEVPPAGHVEISIIPHVSSAQIVRTAGYASSSAQLTKNPTLASGEDALSGWMPVPSIAEHRFEVIHAVEKPESPPVLVGQELKGRKRPNPVYLAVRGDGQESASIAGRIEVDAASTAQVGLEAAWTDVDDNPGLPKVTLSPGSSRSTPRSVVFSRFEPPSPTSANFIVQVVRPGYVQTSADRSLTMEVDGTPYDFNDVFALQCAENKVFLGIQEDGAGPALINFKDPRRKLATVMAVAVGRFSAQFPNSAENAGQLRSKPILVDVPSAIALSSPDVSHILPLIQKEVRREGTARFYNTRYAMRIYVRPSWFESGPGERLGIACAVEDSGSASPRALEKWYSQWGDDPIARVRSEASLRRPRAADFMAVEGADQSDLDQALYPDDGNEGRSDVLYRDGIAIAPGSVEVVSIASFALRQDAMRRLWYCDVQIATDFSGWCGLALYRHQPHANDGCQLSRSADWVYAAVLHGDAVGIVERSAAYHVTVGPIYDRYTTFEFSELEFAEDGVSRGFDKEEPESRKLQQYRVGDALYFEGVVERSSRKIALVKRRFDQKVESLLLQSSN